MSQIQRPTKQGGATTYQGKVGAGYTTILASEMDADLDTIYSAWNTGVDTTNIRDGSITGAKLAAGAVGSRELADSGVATVDLADAAVTTPKLADGAVTPAKIAAGGAPPGGAAGGDLTGTYPNPALSVVQAGMVQLGNGARVAANPTLIELITNELGTPGYDATKPTWMLQLNNSAASDSLFVYRAPAGTASYVLFLQLGADGKLRAVLADQVVQRQQLAINGIYGGSASVPNLAAFILNTPNAWTDYLITPPLTTRGGFVQLYAMPSLSITCPGTQGIVASRWLRDGTTVLQENSWPILTASLTYVPVPGFNWLDSTCPAGSHTYSYQVKVPTGATMLASGITDGGVLACEVG